MSEKILGLRLKVDTTESGKLASVYKETEQSISKTKSLTEQLASLDSKRIAILNEQAVAITKTSQLIANQNAALEKSGSTVGIGIFNAERATAKLNTVLLTTEGQLKAIGNAYDTIAAKSRQIAEANQSAFRASLGGGATSANARPEILQSEVSAASAARQAELLAARVAREQAAAARIATFQQAINASNEAILTNQHQQAVRIREAIDRQAAIDSQSFAQRIRTSVQGSSVGTFANYLRQQSEAATAQNRLNESTRALEITHRNLAVRLLEVIGLYRVYNFVLNGVTNAIKSIPSIGIELEATKAILSSTVGSEAGMGSTLIALQKEAQRTGLSLSSLRENFRLFQASTSLAGESLQDTWTMFTNINTVSTALHLTTDKTIGIFNALAQIFNKSKVQSEELVKQLGNLLPGAFASFQKANSDIFKTIPDLIYQMSQGTVFAHETVLKLTEFLKDRFVAAFAVASQGLNANIGRMKTSFTLLGEAIYGTTSGPMNSFVRGVTDLNNYIIAGINGQNNFITSLTNVATVIGGVLVASIIKAITNVKLLQVSLVSLGGGAVLAALSAVILKIGEIGLKQGAIYESAAARIKAYNDEKTKLDTAKPIEIRVEASGAVQQARKDLAELNSELIKVQIARDEGADKRYIGEKGIVPIEVAESTLVSQIDSQRTLLLKAIEAATLEIAKADQDTRNNIVTGGVNLIDDIAQIHIEAERAVGNNVQAAIDTFDKQYAGKIKAAQESISKIKLELDKESSKGVKSLTDEATRANLEAQLASYTKFVEEAAVVRADVAAKAETKVSSKVKDGLKSAVKEQKDLYKDITRDSKDASDRIAADWQKLDFIYEQGAVSIEEFYAKKQELLEKDLAQQEEANARAMGLAINAGDIAKQEALVDAHRENLLKIGVESEKLYQERTKANKTFNDSLKETNILYLEQFNAIGALREKQAIQTPEKIKLQTEVDAGTAGALQAQQQQASIEANALLQANYEKATKYRHEVEGITESYKSLGATSQDVLAASLGGWSQLANIFDNFITKQETIANKLVDINAEIDNIVSRDIVPGDVGGEIQQMEDLQNATQKQAELEKKAFENKLNLAKQSFATIGSLLKKNSDGQRAAHIAALTFDTAEKLSALSKATVKGAEATINAGTSGDGYTAIARMAAVAAYVAGVIAAVGGATSTGGGSGAPIGNQGTGTVLGDKTTVSESVNNTYTLLKDIHAKEYVELRGINTGISNLKDAVSSTINKFFQAGGVPQSNFKGIKDQQLIKIGFGSSVNADPILNFILGGLFGKTSKTLVGQGIATGATPLSSVIAGQDIAAWQYATIETVKKSWFSKKVSFSEQTSAIGADVQKGLNSIFKNMGQTMFYLSDKLGGTTRTAIEQYIIPALKVDLKDLSAEDAVKKLNGVISATLDTMASDVFGAMLGQYQKLGEGMLETAIRVVAQMAVVRESLERYGKTLTKNAIAISNALVEAAGGLKEFQQQFELFFDKFFTDIEKQQLLQKNLGIVLKEIGLSLPATREGYRKLIASLDLTNAKNRERYSLLLSLSEQADKFYAKDEANRKAFQDSFYTSQQKTIASVKLTGEVLQKLFADNTITGAAKKVYGSLSGVFYNTLRATGDFASAIRATSYTLDVTTAAGKRAYAQLMGNVTILKQYADLLTAIQKPIKDQIANIKDSIDIRTKEDLLQQLSLSKNLTQQQTLATKIQKLITDEYNAKVTAINSIKTSLLALAKTVKDLLLGDLSILNPEQKLTEAAKQYSDLLAKAKAGDAAAISEVSNAAQNYLKEAKSYFSSTEQYAAIFTQVTTALTDLSQSAGTLTDPILAATKSLAESAMLELQNLSKILVEVTTKTIRESQLKAYLDNRAATASAAQQPLILKQQKAFALLGERGVHLEVERQRLQALLADRIKSGLNKTTADKVIIANWQKQIDVITQKVGFKASGGTASGYTIVGENGPELLRLPTNTHVVNNNDTNRLLNAANDRTFVLLTGIKSELTTLNTRMEIIERKTRLGAK